MLVHTPKIEKRPRPSELRSTRGQQGRLAEKGPLAILSGIGGMTWLEGALNASSQVD